MSNITNINTISPVDMGQKMETKVEIINVTSSSSIDNLLRSLGIKIEEIDDIDVPIGASEIEGPSKVDHSGYISVDDCYKNPIY